MRKNNKNVLWIALSFLTAFTLWTIALLYVDAKPIGPQNTVVGFATINLSFHNLTGANLWLYDITDWLSLIPVCFILGFAILGLIQWSQRKSLRKVDQDILGLGIFYIIVMAVYALFEQLVINYRPMLINGFLEASYPSSTTMLVMCVMSTAIMQLNARIKNHVLKHFCTMIMILFIIFMVVCRLISGVHWLTDIIGGILFSAGIILLYYAICFHQ